MSKFIQNIENTAMYLSGESWRINYTQKEVIEQTAPPSGGGKAGSDSEPKILLNNGKLKEKPKFSQIQEGFYRFSKLSESSAIYGSVLEESPDIRKNYKEIILFYKMESDSERLKKNLKDGDVIEFFPIGRLCQGGYNISAERQTQQITNSCGSFVVPLTQVNKTASITALFPSPFDSEKESFSYTLFNSQFQIVNQKISKPIEYQKAKLEKIRFFFLLFSGSSSESQMQSIVTFEGYLLNNSLAQDVSSQAVISFDCPVSLESEIQILNHDYYSNQILG